jgi:hypothetical protein
MRFISERKSFATVQPDVTLLQEHDSIGDLLQTDSNLSTSLIQVKQLINVATPRNH